MGVFAGRKPGTLRICECEFAGHGNPRANLMGATCIGSGRPCGLGGPAGGEQIFRAGCTNDFRVDTRKRSGGFHEIARCFITHGWSEPALLPADRIHDDVRLLLNKSALPLMRLGNVLPEGAFIWVVRGSSGTFPAIHFLLLRLWGSWPRSLPFFRMDQKLGKRCARGT